MIEIVVDNRIRIPLAEIPEALAEDIRSRFRYENPTYKKGGRLTGEAATISTWMHDGDSRLSLPRGGMQRVRDAMRSHGWTYDRERYDFQDWREWSHPEPGFPEHLLTPRDYQVELMDAAEKRQNCLLRAPTGSGKTTAAFGLAARLKRRTLVMVWTGNLLEQWRERCESELGLRGDDVGLIRGSETRIRPITLAMQQSVVQRFERGDRELASAFDVVICDEVQRFAAPTLFAAVDPFRARYRVGISADETRKDGKEFLTRDLFADVACAIDECRLIESGAIVGVEFRVVPTDFRAPWYRFRQDWNKLLEQMTGDESRDAIALGIAAREVKAGQQVILFTHRVDHARKLDAALCGRGIPSGVMLGGKPEEVVFDRTKRGLKSGELRAGVGTYQAIAQGLDLPSVGCGICVTPIGNNRQQVGQTKGRICRASDGKESGRMYYLLDSVYGSKPIRNFASWGYRTSVWVAERGKWLSANDFLKR